MSGYKMQCMLVLVCTVMPRCTAPASLQHQHCRGQQPSKPREISIFNFINIGTVGTGRAAIISVLGGNDKGDHQSSVSVHVFIGGCYEGGSEVQSSAGADWRVWRSVRVTGLLQLGTGTLYCTLYHVTLCIL